MKLGLFWKSFFILQLAQIATVIGVGVMILWGSPHHPLPPSQSVLPPLMPIGVGSVVSLFFAWWSVGYIARPIRTLHEAFKTEASGTLDTQIGAQVGARQFAPCDSTEADSRYSWTIVAARRAKAREEMQPLVDEATRIKAEVVDLKKQLKLLKYVKAAETKIDAYTNNIGEKEKAIRELEARAAAIDALVFDLQVVLCKSGSSNASSDLTSHRK